MKITAIIPVRDGSKRCPRKNIKPFGDTNLLKLRISELLKVKEIDQIQVNSDSEEMLDVARAMGVIPVKRYPYYASDKCNGKELYKCLSEACNTDTMLIAFAPTPFITHEDYTKCIELYKTQDCDSILSVKNVTEYIFKDGKPMNFDPLNTCKSQDLPDLKAMTFGITIVPTDNVRQTHSIWGNNPYLYQVNDLKAMDIDTKLDFTICELLYKNNIISSGSPDKDDKLDEFDEFDIPNDVYLGAVYDAMNIITDDATKYYLNIKPQCGYEKIVHGPALTIQGRKISSNEDYEKMDEIRYEAYNPDLYKNKPIMVLEAGGDMTVAHLGDITCQVYKKLGAVGMITDGITRDADIIDKLKFPVFCKDVTPVDALNKWAYVNHNCPIHLCDKNIFPDDYIFASKDGIIFVPRKLKKKFLVELNNVLIKERGVRKIINDANKNNLQKVITDYSREKGRF